MDISRAVITLWYVTSPNPAAVLEAEPKADRGYGRKFLAQLNPAFPITPIGQFPFNRSAPADSAEYYIGGYPGVTVVQTVIEGEGIILSQLPQALRKAAPWDNLYTFVHHDEDTYAGFAHFQDGELKRSLCCTRMEVLEDSGLPEPFEGPYWAGEHNDSTGGIALPFRPRDLMEEAQRAWLGVDISAQGPDLDVVGYAVDGRPEPKIDKPQRPTIARVTSASAAKLGIGPGNTDYDDYEDAAAEEESTGDEFRALAQASAAAARRVGATANKWWSKASRKVSQSLKDRWRS